MSYIGKEPIVGNFQKCDAITTSSTATYNLTVSSVAVFPETTNNCIVSLNGVIQAPTSAYTISGSQIVFASSLTSSDVIDFILILGSVLSVGTPTDRTVTLAKMATGTDGQIITYDASGNPTAVGPGTDGQVLTSTGAGSPPAFEAIPGGGKVLQVQHAITSTAATSSSSTYADTGLTDAITCSATSSKVLVIVTHNGIGKTSNNTHCAVKLFRQIASGSFTELDKIDENVGMTASTATNFGGSSGFTYLDSPSSTSALTYKTQFMSASNNATVYVQDGSAASSIALIEIGA